jgi:hypothetical protein
MSSSNFSVVYGFGGSSVLDNPLVHFYGGNQLVLAYVARQALMDYFHIPGDRKINTDRWSRVVEENLELFGRLIVEKYERKDWDVHDSYGQNSPLILITLEDMQRSAGRFTANGLNLETANQPTAAYAITMASG